MHPLGRLIIIYLYDWNVDIRKLIRSFISKYFNTSPRGAFTGSCIYMPTPKLIFISTQAEWAENYHDKSAFLISSWSLITDQRNYHIISKYDIWIQKTIISYRKWYLDFWNLSYHIEIDIQVCKNYHIISKMIFKFSKLSHHIKNDISMF